MKKIIWSDLAFLSFSDIANYLTKTYSIDEAIRFDEKVEQLIDQIQNFEKLCPIYKPRPVLRKCSINKHSSLLYRIDSNTIQIISFFDNRGIHPF